MALNFAINSSIAYNGTTLTPRTIGTSPEHAAIYRDASGVVWVANNDAAGNRIQFVPISAADGIITASLITNAAITSRTVGGVCGD